MEQKVSFYSDGLKIAGMLYEPDNAADNSCPGIVMCQGLVGQKEHFWFPEIARHFVDLGMVALPWDFRGVGESEGEPGRLYPLEHAEDIRNALTYLEVHPKVDPERLALIGWSWGGGMVPYVAGVDERVKCAISIVGWGDGERRMREARRYWEWVELQETLAEDRKSRVVTGKSKVVPADQIRPGNPAYAEKTRSMYREIPRMDNFERPAHSLASVERTIEFKPIEVVDRISPRAILYIAAEKDTTNSPEGVVDMYNRTKEPKKLSIIPGIAHYGVYKEPESSQILQLSTDWLKEHLQIK